MLAKLNCVHMCNLQAGLPWPSLIIEHIGKFISATPFLAFLHNEVVYDSFHSPKGTMLQTQNSAVSQLMCTH